MIDTLHLVSGSEYFVGGYYAEKSYHGFYTGGREQTFSFTVPDFEKSVLETNLCVAM